MKLIRFTRLSAALLLLLIIAPGSSLFSQNVGIGTAIPANKLHVEANGAADGIRIDNIAANGDPILQYQVNGTSIITMGVDDSDADKFKIGTAAITTNTRVTIMTGGNVGVHTTAPGNMFHVTNGGVNVGGTSVANFENLGTNGVALSARNTNTASGYNAFEGLIDYNGNGFLTAGVFGLALYNGALSSNSIGVRGHTNEWQGTGMRGSRFNSGGANTGWGGEFYDDLGYTGFFGAISDLRTKKNIQPISSALSILAQLSPVTYLYDLDKYPNMGLNQGQEFGFIAQEVAQVLPNVTRTKTFSTNACTEAVVNGLTENETEEFVVMDYTRLIPILTQAVKEQQQLITDLQLTIDALRAEIRGN